MVKKIIGKTAVDYVSKKTNQRVVGINLHCSYEDRNTEGVAVERLYISSRADFYPAIQTAPIGSEIEIYYNCWGKVEFVQVM